MSCNTDCYVLDVFSCSALGEDRGKRYGVRDEEDEVKDVRMKTPGQKEAARQRLLLGQWMKRINSQNKKHCNPSQRTV